MNPPTLPTDKKTCGYGDMVVCLLVFAGAVFIRLYLSFPISDSGDEFVKWYQNKRVLHDLGWDRLDHHTVRWALNIPTFAIQWLFGTKASVYYLTPALYGGLGSLFVFLISRTVSNSLVALLPTFLFSVTPIVAKLGSQFLPATYTCAYILGSAYFTIRYIRSYPGNNLYLVIASFFLFCAYGTKVPNLFFLPGICACLYITTKSLRPALLMCAILAGLFVLETIVFALYFGEFHLLGRVHYLGFHLSVMGTERQTYEFSDILRRWAILPDYWKFILWGSLGSTLLFFLNRKNRDNGTVLLLLLMLLSFSLLTTFAISSLDPLRFLQPIRVRYLTVTIPLALMLLCCTAYTFHRALTAIITVALAIFYYTENYRPHFQNGWVPAVLRVNDHQDTISEHWKQNYALFFKHKKHARLYRAAYLEDEIVFKDDGSVQKIYKVNPKRFDFPTKNPYIFMIGRTLEPVGYLELTRDLSFKSKKDF